MTDPTTQAPTFIESLPADMRGNASLTKFTDVGAMAKSYLEMESASGRRTMGDMTAPSDDAGVTAVLRKLGAPTDASGYTLPDTPAGRAFRESAHKSGMTGKQAEALFADMTAASDSRSKATTETFEATKTKDRDALRSDWGEKTDANLTIVAEAAKQAFGEADAKMLSDLGLTGRPAVAKFLLRIAPLFQEDGMFGGSAGAGSEGDFKSIRAQRLAMANDKDIKAAMANPMHSQNKDYTAKYQKLMDEEARLAVEGGHA